MSSEQYSPLDTTLPFFSNQVYEFINANSKPIVIPFLLQFKGIARRVKVSVIQSSGSDDTVNVYFNGDLENPVNIGGGGSQTFNRWIKHIRVVSTRAGSIHPVTVEYDVVPVEYLPPKQRRAL